MFALAACLAAGCAAGLGGAESVPGGATGPIAWEIADVGRLVSSDGRRFRWSYAILLRNRGDATFRAERVERSIAASGDIVGGTPESVPFSHAIAAGGELRVPVTENWGWLDSTPVPFGGAATLPGIVARHRFTGTLDPGGAIEVVVQVALDRGVGKLARPRVAPPRLPPATALQDADLPRLGGRWRGSYRAASGVFDVPIALTVERDGAFEGTENDPGTRRFRGTLGIRNGAVAYSAGPDSGELTLYESAAARMLIGKVSNARGTSAQVYSVYLEAEPAPAATSPALPPGGSPPLETAPLAGGSLRAFEEYRAEPRFTPFKAFAADSGAGAWGRAWGQPTVSGAIERAMAECRKRGSACRPYALGDTVVAGRADEDLLAEINRYAAGRTAFGAAASGTTYDGVLSVHADGVPSEVPVTFVIAWRGAKEFSGEWHGSADRRVSGTISGTLGDGSQASVRVVQDRPCRAELAGTATILQDGARLAGTASGSDCRGRPVRTSFAGTRR